MKLDLKTKTFIKRIEDAKRDRFQVMHGDNLEILRKLNPHQFDALVTDPPAGIAFMGKDWDTDKGGRDYWIAWLSEVLRECHRVLKPGAHGVVWSLPKTSHWTAMAIEDAGFEIVDCVMHVFGSGFPKSQDISKQLDKLAGAERTILSEEKTPFKIKNDHAFDSSRQNWVDEKGYRTKITTAPATDIAKAWSGWGTMLKPAYEPWWLIRKPISENNIALNVLKYGVGGINIGESRVGDDDITLNLTKGDIFGNSKGTEKPVASGQKIQRKGRFPANVVFDEDAAMVLDEQSGVSKSTIYDNSKANTTNFSIGGSPSGRQDIGGYSDTGGASRFFYVAKASKADKGDENGHPTVKSTALMEYLIKMVTPKNGTVLDPFMGSGTTGVSAIRNDFKFYGIDQERKYTDLALSRMMGEYKVTDKKLNPKRVKK